MNNQNLVGLSKQISNHFGSKQIILTAKQLPGIFNEEADFEPRNVKDSSEWIFDREIFQKFCSKPGKPETDLFALRVLKQLRKYKSWKSDPFSIGRDVFQTSWSQGLNYAFLHSV